MAYKLIQFRHGMSLPEYLQCFGIETTCAEALELTRWPNGFRCPHCSGGVHCELGHGSRRRFQCNACHHQTSLTAGTLWRSTKLDLMTRCPARYLVSQATTGLSALALKCQIGVSCPTAWLMHHKIMMPCSNARPCTGCWAGSRSTMPVWAVNAQVADRRSLRHPRNA